MPSSDKNHSADDLGKLYCYRNLITETLPAGTPYWKMDQKTWEDLRSEVREMIATLASTSRPALAIKAELEDILKESELFERLLPVLEGIDIQHPNHDTQKVRAGIHSAKKVAPREGTIESPERLLRIESFLDHLDEYITTCKNVERGIYDIQKHAGIRNLLQPDPGLLLAQLGDWAHFPNLSLSLALHTGRQRFLRGHLPRQLSRMAVELVGAFKARTCREPKRFLERLEADYDIAALGSNDPHPLENLTLGKNTQ